MLQSVTPALAQRLSLPVKHGVLVADVESANPGSSSGLQRKDIILSLDEAPVQSERQFNEAIYRRRAGETVRLKVQRGQEFFFLTVKVASHSTPANPLSIMDSVEDSLISRLGIFCIEIDQKVAEAIPDLRTQYGLVVVAGSSESQSTYLDFKPGNVIHELNNLPIASLDLFRQRINQLHRGEARRPTDRAPRRPAVHVI